MEAHLESDLLTVYAGPVKALPGGKMRGPVVIAGGPKLTDLIGDFFTQRTDLGIHKQIPVYFQHGFDPVLKKTRLAVADILGWEPIKGNGDDEMFALWAEYVLDMSNRYHAHLHDNAEAMGHSSGSVAHLVERKALPNGSAEITSWPLAELSLTPEPAEPRMVGAVVPVKAYATSETYFKETTDPVREVVIDVNVNIKQPEEGDMADETKQEGTPHVVTPSQDLTAMLEAMKNLTTSIAGIDEKIESAVKEQMKAFEPVIPVKTGYTEAPALIRKRHDNFGDAFKAWITGDATDALRFMTTDASEVKTQNFSGNGEVLHFKASNATTMTAGTDAQGGAAVPQGHINEIVARRDEGALFRTLGVRNVPGSGQTTHLPIDAEDNGIWVSTTENASTDMDSPAMDTIAFTLVAYSKRVPLTRQLLTSETSGLLAFIEDFVGRGLGKLENNLLVTATAASGTAFVSFASSIAIAFGELEDIVGDDDLGDYLDDSMSTAWVTRNSTYWGQIAQITSSDNRMYAATAGEGSTFSGPRILGYPVHMSQQVTAIGAQGNPSAKAIHFGNWNFVGRYASPEFFVLRDPYSGAANARVNLHYWMQVVYKVIQAEAIGYGAGLDV